MIKISDLKTGDYIIAEYEGKQWQGEVVNLNHDEKQICVATEVQEFWYEEKDLHPLPLSDKQMQFLAFEKEVQEDGCIKYKKSSFRLVIAGEEKFDDIEMWYREDRRHHPNVHSVHQLQNQYLDMTKIHLTNHPL